MDLRRCRSEILPKISTHVVDSTVTDPTKDVILSQSRDFSITLQNPEDVKHIGCHIIEMFVHKNWLCVGRNSLRATYDIQLECWGSYVNRDDERILIEQQTHQFPEIDDLLLIAGMKNQCEKIIHMKHFWKVANLTIKVKNPTDRREELMEEIRLKCPHGANSTIVIECIDGKLVEVHKEYLSSRCPFFQQLFRYNHRQPRINVGHLDFLQYIISVYPSKWPILSPLDYDALKRVSDVIVDADISEMCRNYYGIQSCFEKCVNGYRIADGSASKEDIIEAFEQIKQCHAERNARLFNQPPKILRRYSSPFPQNFRFNK